MTATTAAAMDTSLTAAEATARSSPEMEVISMSMADDREFRSSRSHRTEGGDRHREDHVRYICLTSVLHLSYTSLTSLLHLSVLRHREDRDRERERQSSLRRCAWALLLLSHQRLYTSHQDAARMHGRMHGQRDGQRVAVEEVPEPANNLSSSLPSSFSTLPSSSSIVSVTGDGTVRVCYPVSRKEPDSRVIYSTSTINHRPRL